MQITPNCLIVSSTHMCTLVANLFCIAALTGYEQTTTHIFAMVEYKLHQGEIVDKHYFAFFFTRTL